MCAHLAQLARERQGCGSDEADLGPLLNLAIDCETDIRVVFVSRTTGRAEIPSPAVPGHAKGSHHPQLVRMRRIAGHWKITELRLVDPRTPMGRHGKRGKAFPHCKGA